MLKGMMGDDLPEQVWSDWQKRKIDVKYVGSRPGMYNTIQEAIGRAQKHDRVEVMSGTYNEAVVITKEIELCAGMGETPEIVMWGTCLTVSSPTTAYVCGIDLVQTDKNHEVPSLTITDGSPIVTQCKFPSVLVVGSATPHLERNEIADSWNTSGIRMKAYSGGVFHRNLVYSHSNYCLELHNAGATLFTENDFGIIPGKIGRRGKGIAYISFDNVKFGATPTFQENRFTDPNDDRVVADRSERRREEKSAARAVDSRERAAIVVAELSEVTFESNDFSQCETGLRVVGRVKMRDNMFSRLRGFGVYLVDGSDGDLEENRFFECEGGAIEVHNASPNLVRNRITGFARGGDGIVVNTTNPQLPATPRVEGNVLSRVRGAGLRITNSNGSYTQNLFEEAYGSAVVVTGGQAKPTIDQNRFLVGNAHGISAQQDSRPVVSNNFISHYTVGISMLSGAQPHVTTNEILECVETGMLVASHSRGLIEKNKLDSNKNGVTIATLARPVLRKNIIVYSGNCGIRCIDRARPFIEQNQICDNRTGGLEVESHADPVVYDNFIARNLMHGVALLKNGFGTFTYNKMESNGTCVSASTGSRPTFRKNIFSASSAAVHVQGGACGTFEKNNVTDCGDGMVVSGKDSNPALLSNFFTEIKTRAVVFNDHALGCAVGNVFSDILVGIVIDESSKPKVVRNRLLNVTSASIVIRGQGTAPHVQSNTIMGSTGRGIDCEEGSCPRLTENLIGGCQMGIRLRGKGTVVNNEFKENVCGLVADSGCTAVVQCNKFTGSTEACVSVLAGAAGTYEENDIEDSEVGILVEGATAKALFKRNTIIKNRFGVRAHRDESRKGKTLFTNNTVMDSSLANVLSEAGGYLTMKDNILKRAPVGVLCRQGGRGLFEDNAISDSKEANVRVLSTASPVLKHNKFANAAIGVEVTDGGKGCYTANDFSNTVKNMVVGTKAEPTVTHTDLSGSREDGLLLDNGASGTYRFNTFSNNARNGIYVMAGCSPTFEENIISCNGFAGIRVEGEATGKYRRNQILDNVGEGILVCLGCRPVIEQNEITRNKIGIGVYETAYGNFMENNVFLNKTAGMVVKGGSYPHVELNAILHEEVGIVFEASAGNVYENRVVQCDVGCELLSGGRPAVSRNLFALNTVGLRCEDGSAGNVSQNIIYANTTGVQVCAGGGPMLTQNLFTLREATAEAADDVHWGTPAAAKRGLAASGDGGGSSGDLTTTTHDPTAAAGYSNTQQRAPVRLAQFVHRGTPAEPGGLTNPRPLGLPRGSLFGAQGARRAADDTTAPPAHMRSPVGPEAISPRRRDPAATTAAAGGGGGGDANAQREATRTGIATPPTEAVGAEVIGGGGTISHNVFVHITVGVRVVAKLSSPLMVSSNSFAEGRVGVECSLDATPEVDGNRFTRHEVCGIQVSNNAAPHVLHNVIQREAVGVLLDEDAAGLYEKNSIDNNDTGCKCTNGQHSRPTVRSNQFAENKTGIFATRGSALQVQRNYFVSSEQHGLLVENASAPEVTENCFSHHGDDASGLCVEREGRGLYQGNVWAMNTQGVVIRSRGDPTMVGNLLYGHTRTAVLAQDFAIGVLRRNAFRVNKADLELRDGATTAAKHNSFDSEVLVVDSEAVFTNNTLTGRVHITGSSADPMFENNFVSEHGMLIEDGARGSFKTNVFSKINEKAWALDIRSGADPQVTENQFLQLRHGVQISREGKGAFASNMFNNGKVGMQVVGGHPVLSGSNVFDSLERGMIFTGATAKGDFTETQVLNCSATGVLIEKGADPKFEACEIFDSHVGLRINDGKGRVANCDIYDNNTGIQLLQDSSGHVSFCRISSPSDAGCVQKDFHGSDRNVMEQNTLRNNFSPFSPCRRNYKRDRDDDRRKHGRRDLARAIAGADRKIRDSVEAEDRIIAELMWILKLHRLDTVDLSPRALLNMTAVPARQQRSGVPSFLERTPPGSDAALEASMKSMKSSDNLETTIPALRQSKSKLALPELEREDSNLSSNAPSEGGTRRKSVRGGKDPSRRRATIAATARVAIAAASGGGPKSGSAPAKRRQSRMLPVSRRASEAVMSSGPISPLGRTTVQIVPDDDAEADTERGPSSTRRGRERTGSKESAAGSGKEGGGSAGAGTATAPNTPARVKPLKKRMSTVEGVRRLSQWSRRGRERASASAGPQSPSSPPADEPGPAGSPRSPRSPARGRSMQARRDAAAQQQQQQQQRIVRTTRRKSSHHDHANGAAKATREPPRHNVDESALQGLQALNPLPDKTGAVESLAVEKSKSPVTWGQDSPARGSRTESDQCEEINFYSGLAQVLRPAERDAAMEAELAVMATSLQGPHGRRLSHNASRRSSRRSSRGVDPSTASGGRRTPLGRRQPSPCDDTDDRAGSKLKLGPSEWAQNSNVTVSRLSLSMNVRPPSRGTDVTPPLSPAVSQQHAHHQQHARALALAQQAEQHARPKSPIVVRAIHASHGIYQTQEASTQSPRTRRRGSATPRGHVGHGHGSGELADAVARRGSRWLAGSMNLHGAAQDVRSSLEQRLATAASGLLSSATSSPRSLPSQGLPNELSMPIPFAHSVFSECDESTTADPAPTILSPAAENVDGDSVASPLALHAVDALPPAVGTGPAAQHQNQRAPHSMGEAAGGTPHGPNEGREGGDGSGDGAGPAHVYPDADDEAAPAAARRPAAPDGQPSHARGKHAGGQQVQQGRRGSHAAGATRARPLEIVNRDTCGKVGWVWGVLRAEDADAYTYAQGAAPGPARSDDSMSDATPGEGSLSLPPQLYAGTYPPPQARGGQSATAPQPQLAPGFYFESPVVGASSVNHAHGAAQTVGAGSANVIPLAQQPPAGGPPRRPRRGRNESAVAAALSLPALSVPTPPSDPAAPPPPRWGSSTQPVHVRKLPRGPPPVERHPTAPKQYALPEMSVQRLRRLAPHLKRTLKQMQTTQNLQVAEAAEAEGAHVPDAPTDEAS